MVVRVPEPLLKCPLRKRYCHKVVRRASFLHLSVNTGLYSVTMQTVIFKRFNCVGVRLSLASPLSPFLSEHWHGYKTKQFV